MGNKVLFDDCKGYFLKLHTVDEINDFVVRASKTDGDIFVSRGAYCVDGKSLMGVYSIDMSQGVWVHAPNNELQFLGYLASIAEDEDD